MHNQDDNVNQYHPADMVFEALHTVMHLYRSNHLQAIKEVDSGLTHMESRVLDYFYRNPGATLSDLVSHSGKDKAQLTRLIRGLRENKYLEAKEDATDRRSVHLTLSTSGRNLHIQLKRYREAILKNAVLGLSTEQCDELMRTLSILQKNLECAR